MTSGHNVAYVAARPIPPSKPPVSKTGVIHWLRRNLFNGVVNSLLSLTAITLILPILLPILEWAVFNGVWHADSLDECREIVAASHGEGAHGACWAVFMERIGPLLFGFYPPELYWRPVLAFILLPVALAPILSGSLPRRMLWFSAIYPFIAYNLIWGGFGLEGATSDRLGGLLLTITLTVAGTAAAIPVGIALALGRQFLALPLRVFCGIIAEFFRGVPLIVLVFAVFFFSVYFLPAGTWVYLILRAVILIALHSGVRMADAIRGELQALGQGQWEAASALGLNRRKALWLVILPQALRRAAPRIALATAGLFRDTTIVVMSLGLLDPLGLMGAIRADADWNGILWELLAVTALSYGVFCFAITWYAKHLERKLKAENCRPINPNQPTGKAPVFLDTTS